MQMIRARLDRPKDEIVRRGNLCRADGRVGLPIRRLVSRSGVELWDIHRRRFAGETEIRRCLSAVFLCEKRGPKDCSYCPLHEVHCLKNKQCN